MVGGRRLAGEELREEHAHEQDEPTASTASSPRRGRGERSSTLSSATSDAKTASSDGSCSVVRSLVHGIVADDVAVLQDDDARADLLDHFEDVRAEDDHLALGGERADERLQDARGADVEAGKGLVEDDDARIVEDRGGDEYFLTHALRVGRQRLVAVVVDARGAAGTVRSCRQGLAREAGGAGRLSCKYSGPVR